MKLLPLIVVVASAQQLDHAERHNQYLWKDLHSRAIGWRRQMLTVADKTGQKRLGITENWISLAQQSYDKMEKKTGRSYPKFACDIGKYRDHSSCIRDISVCAEHNWL